MRMEARVPPSAQLFSSHPNLSDAINHDIVQSEIEGGVYLADLPPESSLEIETKNHFYTVLGGGQGEVLISGHPDFCPVPVAVRILGSNWGGSYVLDDWTPDGKTLTLTWREVHPDLYNVSLLPVAGRDDPVRLLESKGANVSSSKVSPDGHWIAYRSDESGKPEIYISSFPNPAGRLQVSTDGGVAPRWSHDGRTLYYLAADKKLMAAQLKETNGSLQVIATPPLFDMPNATYLTPAAVNQYDVTHDGSEFAVDSLDTDASSAPLNVVLNWPEELKK